MSPRARQAIVNAAFVASRPPTVATAKELGRVRRALHREDIVPVGPRMLIGGLISQRDHLVPDASAELIVLPATNPERVQPTDFDHAGRLIGTALAAARTALAATPVARAGRSVNP